VQTFLPYAGFAESAAVLDDKRLGKQRVETLQILRALCREKYGWKRHPAVLMWQGYEAALACYGVAVCDEWISRGRQDTCRDKILEEVLEITGTHDVCSAPRPPWLGDERLHASHRSSLLRKDPDHYSSRFISDPDDLPYFWPTHEQA
jgi:hypothetical protein